MGQLQERFHAVGHRHERDARVRPHEARIGLAARRCVDHLRREVGRAPRGHRGRGDQPRQADAAEIDLARQCLGGELLVIAGVVTAQVLAVELVATVHRRRVVVVVLLDLARPRFHFQAGQAVRGNRRRVHEAHRPAVRFALALGELQEGHRPLDVDAVRRRRGELAARG